MRIVYRAGDRLGWIVLIMHFDGSAQAPVAERCILARCCICPKLRFSCCVTSFVTFGLCPHTHLLPHWALARRLSLLISCESRISNLGLCLPMGNLSKNLIGFVAYDDLVGNFHTIPFCLALQTEKQVDSECDAVNRLEFK